MLRYIHYIVFAILFCTTGKANAQPDSSKKDRHTIPKKQVPIWGYRFVITGDFNGDGKIDTLKEHYLNGHTKKEIPKYFDSLDFDQLVGLTATRQGTCIVTCSDTAIHKIFIGNRQVFGLSYLKNEGDLDGDGGDEISYVVDYADWSAVNSCHLLTYKNGKWKELLHFEIRDWQIQEIPMVSKKKSMWGAFLGADNTAKNRKLEQKVKGFKGFIKKEGPGKIRIHYIDMMEEPSERNRTIDLHHIPAKFK